MIFSLCANHYQNKLRQTIFFYLIKCPGSGQAGQSGSAGGPVTAQGAAGRPGDHSEGDGGRLQPPQDQSWYSEEQEAVQAQQDLQHCHQDGQLWHYRLPHDGFSHPLYVEIKHVSSNPKAMFGTNFLKKYLHSSEDDQGPQIFRRALPYSHAGKVSDLGHP